MRVAYYSPMPPDRSGVADYSALLSPALAERVELEVLADPPRRPPRADLRVYHIGNSPGSHGWIVDELRERPGVVVLHDFVLHHLVAGLTLARGDGNAYLDAMQDEAGLVGRLLAHGVIDGLLPPLWEVRPQDFPLARPVVSLADGVVVHSRYAAERVRGEGYAGPVWVLPHPAWRPPSAPDAPPGLAGEPLIASIGNVTPSKRVPELLAAFARLKERQPRAQLVLAGAVSGVDLDDLLARHRLEAGADVAVFAYVDEPTLWALLAACDVCVNLRWPTMGETSGIAIRALSLGKPLVVSDVGWFRELPEAAAVRIPVDESEVDSLAAALGRLAGNAALRAEMAQAARSTAERVHALERVADLYVAVFEEAVGGAAVRDAVLEDVAAAAHAVGLRAHDGETGELGERLREVGLGR